MNRLNILVTCRFHVLDNSGGATFHAVRIRNGWADVPERDDRPTGMAIEVGTQTPEDLSEEIRQAVAGLRDAWGNLHVQDNSGLVPDLHQGKWNG
jgi:hypothetical protein